MGTRRPLNSPLRKSKDASGAESDAPMAWVITVRDGKVVRHRGFETRDEALAAVGLSE